MKEKYNKEKMDLTLEETMLAFRLNAMCFGQSESKINEQLESFRKEFSSEKEKASK